MLKAILKFVGTALVSVATIQAQKPPQAANPVQAPSDYRAVLNRYCVTCHNDKLKIAGLTLEKLDVGNVPAEAETWEKVIRKLRGGAMPPPKLPRPDKATYDSFATYLETSIDRAAAASPNPGRPAVHRLNRTEYVNAVHDLLAVDIDADSILPADDTGGGFDNIGAVLSVSPVLLERYISAARKISRMAIGDPAMRQTTETYEVLHELRQEDRMSENLTFGSRGGMAVRHDFPADGEYLLKVRMVRDGDRSNGSGGSIRAISVKSQIDVRLDGARLRLFTVGGERFGKSKRNEYDKGGDAKQVEYENTADDVMQVRFPVKAGPHLLGVDFIVEDRSAQEGVNIWGASRGADNGEPGIDTVSISGPFDPKGLGETPSRQKVFVCHPSAEQGANSVKLALPAGSGDEACARKILSTLARRAYRHAPTDDDLELLMRKFRMGRSEGGFEEGIRMALERILVGPKFLFRIERDPANATPGSVYRISDLDLASRLSFFLWSSIPDDELLNVAETGKLHDPAVLEQQARRMLRDPRSKIFVSNFFGQWLQLRHVANLTPDRGEFPDFDENLRQAFEKETELFLESMVREDRPLMELLDADYTFVNERLARHYGIPNIYGNTFQRVTLTDENRRGLLGQGSILSLTSYPIRTSVVLRGVWLLTNILGTPPPPPPPNVPSLKERSDDGKVLSVRQSMEAHRANPVCASCHLRMDPLGFAMENFNGIGQWRTTEGADETPIDSSGTLPDGTKLQGPADLRKLLMSQPGQFSLAVIERLLTYAMGRGSEYYDQPAIRKISREAAPDYRWSSLILGVIKSEPFQMRRTLEP